MLRRLRRKRKRKNKSPPAPSLKKEGERFFLIKFFKKLFLGLVVEGSDVIADRVEFVGPGKRIE